MEPYIFEEAFKPAKISLYVKSENLQGLSITMTKPDGSTASGYEVYRDQNITIIEFTNGSYPIQSGNWTLTITNDGTSMADFYMDYHVIYPSDGTSTIDVTVNNIVANGMVVVAAAGNEGFLGNRTICSPASAEKAIAVGATDMFKNLADFSSIGPTGWGSNQIIKPDIVTPGVWINSTYPQNLDTEDGIQDGYYHINGTSMATPHVSGLIALMLQANNSLTPDQIRQILESTSIDLGDEGKDNFYGAGLVNAIEALYQLLPYPVVIYKPIAYVGEEVIFNASESYDPEGGSIISYEWDFGDGTKNMTSNPAVTHTYSTPGNYLVTLNVTDDENGVNSTSIQIEVIELNKTNLSLSASLAMLTLFFDGTAYQQNTTVITFNATDDTEIANVTLEIWNSTSIIQQITNSSVGSNYYENSTALTVNKPGTYRIVLKAYDIFGNINTTTMYIYAIGGNITQATIQNNTETEIKVADNAEIVISAGDGDAQIRIIFEKSPTNETLNVPEPEKEPLEYLNITGRAENVTVMKVRVYYPTKLLPLVYWFNKTDWELVDGSCLEMNLLARYIDINMTRLAEIEGFASLSEFLADPVMALVVSPDLIVESISVNPKSPSANQQVTISVTIDNTGDANATAFYVSIYVNSNLIKAERVNSLNVSESRTITASWSPPSSETYTIRTFVDSGNEVTESNETNNIKTVTVTVSALTPSGGGTGTGGTGTGGTGGYSGGGYAGGGGYWITPTPTPTPSPTETPEMTPTREETPVPERTETPVSETTPAEKEKGIFGIPGFESVLALAGLLAVAYLLRRKQ